MPIIPFQTRSAPLKDGPAFVQDKNARPTVDNSGVSNAVGNLAKASKQPELPNELAAPFGALGAVGAAIAKTGDVLSALAMKQQEAKTLYQVSDMDKESGLEFARLMSDATRDPTMDIQAETAKRAAALRQKYSQDETLTPQARTQIDLRLNRWEGQTAAEAMSFSARRDFALARSALLDERKRAMEAQDKPAFDDATKKLTGGGYEYGHALPETDFTERGKQLKREAESDAFERARDSVTAFAGANGAEVTKNNLRNNAFGKVGEYDQKRLEDLADSIEDKARFNFANTVANGLVDGSIISEAKIKELAEKNPMLFTPALQEKARDALRTENLEAAAADREKNGVRNAVELRQRIKAYDPKKDADRTEYFKLAREINVRADQSQAGELTNDLRFKYDPEAKKLPVRPEIQRYVTQSLNAIFDPKNGAIPWEKEVPETVKDSSGNVKIKNGQPVLVKDANGNIKTQFKPDKAAQIRAYDAEAAIESKMLNWYRLNPSATTEQVKKKLNELLPEGTRQGALDVLKRLSPTLPPGATRKQIEAATELPEPDMDPLPPVGIFP